MSARSPIFTPNSSRRFTSSDAEAGSQQEKQPEDTSSNTKQPKTTSEGPARGATAKSSKTMAQLDEEMRAKMEDMSGEGGAAGVEYENGVAQGLKKEVKRNMFRVI
ncbi:hypothetical protein ACRE_050120 [Hapsidospora chrysogenum ATCC 11550]|uniref:Uncharacterized protein n=1 Tax=Hapsidospora chrysogenum (strain ATCC 11550 / CBS 779.69 / DSM 880 / IAM 14645 / JCM 23072 / IMI 49137) TaxID=857340 RepID=A0A086T4D3_HAPC1|nr:hypothetical protein ACRE_050120 [Hapsidospora chrysogenum ATCC 11550]